MDIDWVWWITITVLLMLAWAMGVSWGFRLASRQRYYTRDGETWTGVPSSKRMEKL